MNIVFNSFENAFNPQGVSFNLPGASAAKAEKSYEDRTYRQVLKVV